MCGRYVSTRRPQDVAPTDDVWTVLERTPPAAVCVPARCAYQERA
ncbi:SOS response-associated peptidase [Streptomyces sp. 2231.1]|nr:SOS response-associated peptidase [Streptomyces sp. 2231.1]